MYATLKLAVTLPPQNKKKIAKNYLPMSLCPQITKTIVVEIIVLCA